MSWPSTTPFQTDFPELDHLSREDLEDLLADSAYYDAIVHSLPHVQAIEHAQNELAYANQTIAQRNMELSEQLYALRTETTRAFEEAKGLQAKQAVLEREQKEIYSRYDPSFLLLRLRHATTAQDDHSEAVATAFVKSHPQSEPSLSDFMGGNGGKDVDDFVKEFRELRKVYHKRKMWGDRWAAGDVQWRKDY